MGVRARDLSRPWMAQPLASSLVRGFPLNSELTVVACGGGRQLRGSGMVVAATTLSPRVTWGSSARSHGRHIPRRRLGAAIHANRAPHAASAARGPPARSAIRQRDAKPREDADAHVDREGRDGPKLDRYEDEREGPREVEETARPGGSLARRFVVRRHRGPDASLVAESRSRATRTPRTRTRLRDGVGAGV